MKESIVQTTLILTFVTRYEAYYAYPRSKSAPLAYIYCIIKTAVLVIMWIGTFHHFVKKWRFFIKVKF